MEPLNFQERLTKHDCTTIVLSCNNSFVQIPTFKEIKNHLFNFNLIKKNKIVEETKMLKFLTPNEEVHMRVMQVNFVDIELYGLWLYGYSHAVVLPETKDSPSSVEYIQLVSANIFYFPDGNFKKITLKLTR